jgi:hypothetical protein
LTQHLGFTHKPEFAPGVLWFSLKIGSHDRVLLLFSFDQCGNFAVVIFAVLVQQLVAVGCPEFIKSVWSAEPRLAPGVLAHPAPYKAVVFLSPSHGLRKSAFSGEKSTSKKTSSKILGRACFSEAAKLYLILSGERAVCRSGNIFPNREPFLSPPVYILTRPASLPDGSRLLRGN